MFTPQKTLKIGEVTLAVMLDEYLHDDNADMWTLLYYFYDMTDTQQGFFIPRMLAFYQNVSIKTLTSMCDYSFVKLWNIRHNQAIDNFFYTALQRKKSMASEMLCIAQWRILSPDNSQWLEHLNGELTSWKQHPTTNVSSDTVFMCLQHLPSNHAKRDLLQFFYIHMLAKERTSDAIMFTMIQQHLHLFKNKKIPSHLNRVFVRYLMIHHDDLYVFWSNLDATMVTMLTEAMINAHTHTKVYAQLLCNHYRAEVADVIEKNKWACSFYDADDFIAVYTTYNINSTKGIHELYKMAISNDDRSRALFLVFYFNKEFDILDEENSPIFLWFIDDILQKNIGWTLCYIIISLLSCKSHFFFGVKELTSLNLTHSQMRTLEILVEKFPFLQSTLMSATLNSNLFVAILLKLAEMHNEYYITTQHLNDGHFYTFPSALFDFFGERLEIDDGQIKRYRARILQMPTYDADLTPLLDYIATLNAIFGDRQNSHEMTLLS